MPIPFTEISTGTWAEQGDDAKLDYGVDWGPWAEAGAPSDTITDSQWAVVDGGVDLTLSAASYSGWITAVFVEGGTPGAWYTVKNTITTNSGRRDSRLCLIYIRPSTGDSGSVFGSRPLAIAKMRRDRLMMLAATLLPETPMTDDMIWDKLRAAESEISHELRVQLVPTMFFPETPTSDEITALAGMPWKVDPGYDYNPNSFRDSSWGMIRLRNKPVREITRLRFVYPGGPESSYLLPLDWVRMDHKYGTVQFVPSNTAFAAPLATFMMQVVASGRTLPLAIQPTYIAGLEDAAKNYPELLDAIYKTACLKILQDAFLPASGSISADGLSQSMSVDMSKYEDSVDRILNGGKGSNGGLMTAIHGVRMGFVGGS